MEDRVIVVEDWVCSDVGDAPGTVSSIAVCDVGMLVGVGADVFPGESRVMEITSSDSRPASVLSRLVVRPSVG